jgi:hypothetical protein
MCTQASVLYVVPVKEGAFHSDHVGDHGERGESKILMVDVEIRGGINSLWGHPQLTVVSPATRTPAILELTLLAFWRLW